MTIAGTVERPAATVRSAGGGASTIWVVGAMIAAGLVVLPVAAVIWFALTPTENIWPHLMTTVLPRQLKNTAILLAGNAVGVVVLGVGAAWLVTMCRFPGRRIFEWALLLPLAMPAYITAFVYTDLLEFAGPVQRSLRAVFGWRSPADYWFPEIRSLGGAIFVMSAVLYPYVYLLARATFLDQSVCMLEAGRVLGRSAWRSFTTIALPLARPAIVAGTALALMETLNDFGTVDFFAVNTLTRGVFNVWINMGNAGGAAQISLVLLAVIIILLSLERNARRHRRYHHTTARYRPLPGYTLYGPRRWAAMLACAAPIVLGFVIPASVLVRNAVGRFAESWNADFLVFARNSLLLSATAAVAAVAIAVFLTYAQRLHRSPALSVGMRIASVGYAIPGAVLAIGVLLPFARLDNAVDGIMREVFGVSTGLILTGSVFALVFAYVVRFLAVALGAVGTSMGRLRPSMEMAARALGAGPRRALMRVHFPLIRGGLLAAATIVFVDTMKELPATLILRPFNFDTLATHVFQFASDELFERSSLAALTIVVAGVVPVILLSRAIGRSRPGRPFGSPLSPQNQ